jgi:nucleotide-binding universal stress UspA family protein
MMKQNSILVGIDIDHDVDNIIDLSSELAYLTDSEISFLHVFRPDIKQQETVDNTVLSQHFDKLKELVKPNLRIDFDADRVNYIVETGFAMEKLLDTAKEIAPDYLILGIRPSQSQLSAHFASVARSILNYWQGRVLLVPNHFKLTDFNEIVVTIDFQFAELEYLLDVMILAERLDAHVTCLHIQGKDENTQLIQRHIQTIKGLFYAEVEAEMIDFEIVKGKTSEGIKKYVDDHDVDLLCMMSGKRSLFGSMIKPSTAFQLSKSLNIPIMVAKHPSSPALKA